MHEMQNAVSAAQGQSDMRGRIQSGPVPRNNSDNVAGLQLWLDFPDPIFGDLIERSARYVRLHPSERAEQGAVCREIAVMPPSLGHFPRRVWNTFPAQVLGQISD